MAQLSSQVPATTTTKGDGVRQIVQGIWVSHMIANRPQMWQPPRCHLATWPHTIVISTTNNNDGHVSTTAQLTTTTLSLPVTIKPQHRNSDTFMDATHLVFSLQQVFTLCFPTCWWPDTRWGPRHLSSASNSSLSPHFFLTSNPCVIKPRALKRWWSGISFLSTRAPSWMTFTVTNILYLTIWISERLCLSEITLNDRTLSRVFFQGLYYLTLLFEVWQVSWPDW